MHKGSVNFGKFRELRGAYTIKSSRTVQTIAYHSRWMRYVQNSHELAILEARVGKSDRVESPIIVAQDESSLGSGGSAQSESSARSTFQQYEHHAQNVSTGEAVSRADPARWYGGEGGFNRLGGVDMDRALTALLASLRTRAASSGLFGHVGGEVGVQQSRFVPGVRLG